MGMERTGPWWRYECERVRKRKLRATCPSRANFRSRFCPDRPAQRRSRSRSTSHFLTQGGAPRSPSRPPSHERPQCLSLAPPALLLRCNRRAASPPSPPDRFRPPTGLQPSSLPRLPERVWRICASARRTASPDALCPPPPSSLARGSWWQPQLPPPPPLPLPLPTGPSSPSRQTRSPRAQKGRDASMGIRIPPHALAAAAAAAAVATAAAAGAGSRASSSLQSSSPSSRSSSSSSSRAPT
jgi:hypothetical protein